MSVWKLIAFVTASAAFAQQPAGPPKQAFYAAAGPDLTQFDVDTAAATLTRKATITLPGAVQYAWPHPSHRWLYVAWGDATQPRQGLTVFAVDSAGALRPAGAEVLLHSRVIHLSTDIPGRFLLVAYNNPSGLTVHPIGADGIPGQPIRQSAKLDFGIYAHQVRVDPANRLVILVTRGNGPTADKPEDPGALKLFRFADGVLTARASIAPGKGIDFQPRHIDFDPAQRWVYVSLERQNKLQVYKLEKDSLSALPIFVRDSLADPGQIHPAQMAGTVHVHPSGRWVYQANRASGTIDFQGQPVFAGGENTIAVYAVDAKTGEPKRIQSADTRGLHPRTFSLGAGLLVAANQMSLPVREGNRVRTVPASLSVFRISGGGTLDYVRQYEIDTGDARSLFWAGFVSLPSR